MSELAGASAASGLASPRRRRRGFSPAIALAAVIVSAVIIAAAIGPLIAPHDPSAQDLLVGLQPPGGEYLLGTDDLGRDILSRTIVGARTAVVGPLMVAAGAMLLGNVLGLIAGYRGGLTDTIISRAVDLVYSMPALLVAIVVVGVLGGGYFLSVALLVVLFSPIDTRIVRAATLEQRSRPYVEAARVIGLSGSRIMFRHIWPNVLPLAVANAFLTFAFSVVALSALSFLGLGVGPGTADWGRMLAESRTLLFYNAAAALAPGLSLVAMAASVNAVGDWIFESLTNRGRSR